MTDKTQAISGMTTRQKATAGVMVVVVLVILWQMSGMFGGGSSGSTGGTKSTAMSAGPKNGPGGSTQSQMMTPKTVDIMAQQPAAMTQREAELMKLQQETQAKYLQALNELQILKITKEIAVANKDISSAKLSRVVAEKKIVDILTPPTPPSANEAISRVNTAQVTAPQPTSYSDQEVHYTVVSISQLQNKWSAVIGYKGTLFNVHVGDTLSPDGSMVEKIQRDGVTISKDGKKQDISLVPVI